MVEEKASGDRPEVLYLSPLPPPAGGISTWTRILFERGLPNGWVPRLVDTSVGPGRQIFRRSSLVSEVRRGLRIWTRFLGTLVRRRPAVVHCNVDALSLGFYRDLTCALVARGLGIPVVLHYRGLVARLEDMPPGSFRVRAARTAARRVDLNLVLNEASRGFVSRIALGSRTRIVSLPNFYDERTLPYAEPTRRNPSERPRVVFVGGVNRAKGCAEILEVASRLPDVDFELVGAVYEELGEAIRKRPGNVALAGELEHPAVLERLRTAQLFLFPTAHGEGFPNAVLEAMALGLPVVATPVGAIPEMVEEGRGGYLVERDPARLAEAVRNVLSDEERRLAMGRFNQLKCRREYSYPVVTERLASLYDALIGRTAAA